jgi:hypothetical protein
LGQSEEVLKLLEPKLSLAKDKEGIICKILLRNPGPEIRKDCSFSGTTVRKDLDSRNKGEKRLGIPEIKN